MSLADDFDKIGVNGPRRPKRKSVADTTQIKRAIDFDKSVRANAISTRDAARADSSSLESMSDLAGREWAFKDIAKQQHVASTALGEKARAADSTVAASAAKIGANQAALNKARKP